jgi:hypothetical protein
MGELLKRAYELQLELGLSSKEEVLQALGIDGEREREAGEPNKQERNERGIEIGG